MSPLQSYDETALTLPSSYGDVDHAITFKRLSATFAEASIETCKPCWNTRSAMSCSKTILQAQNPHRRSELAEYEIWALLLETDDPVTGPPPAKTKTQTSQSGWQSPARARPIG